MANFWEGLVEDLKGGFSDYLGDSQTWRDWFSYLLADDPKMSVKQLQKLASVLGPMNNPNVISPLAKQTTTFDPETGQATVKREIPEGSLNMLNSRMENWSEGAEFWRAPDAMYDHGDQLWKYRQAANNMPETGGEWWRAPERGAGFEFVPFSNDWSSSPGGGGGGGYPLDPDPFGDRGDQEEDFITEPGGGQITPGQGGLGGVSPGGDYGLPPAGEDWGDYDPYSGGIHDTIDDMLDENASWIREMIVNYGDDAVGAIVSALTGSGLAGSAAEAVARAALERWGYGAPISNPVDNPNGPGTVPGAPPLDDNPYEGDIHDIIDEENPPSSPLYGEDESGQEIPDRDYEAFDSAHPIDTPGWYMDLLNAASGDPSFDPMEACVNAGIYPPKCLSRLQNPFSTPDLTPGIGSGYNPGNSSGGDTGTLPPPGIPVTGVEDMPGSR